MIKRSELKEEKKGGGKNGGIKGSRQEKEAK